LKKNPAYWDADHVKLDQAIFYLTEDTTALLNLYRAGEIDTMISGLLPVQQIPLLRQQDDYVSGPFLSLYHYILNVTKPPLDEREVRQALNLSLNRPQICHRVLQAGQQPAQGLTPGDFGGQYPRPPAPSFELPAAKDLMNRAGYPDGRGLRLRLIFSSLDVHRQIAEAAQAQWRAAFPEIQIELVNMEWQVFRQAREQKDFDLAMRHWTADYNDPYSFLELMLADNSNNLTGWVNPQYDRLIHQANATSVAMQRFYLLGQGERVLLNDLPFIPIYEGVTFFLNKPYVQGWYTNILDKHPLKFVWIGR
jgi:oligopeptide transport system substrate-binding protein